MRGEPQFLDRPPDPIQARITTIGARPLVVQWTGPPVWVLLHWLPDAGWKGRSMPCTGDGCQIHTTAPKWRVYAPAAQPRPAVRPSVPKRREDLMAAYAALPEERKEQLRAMASNRRARGDVTPDLIEEFLGQVQTSVPAPEGPQFEPLVIDMPSGCAVHLSKEYQAAEHWRGQTVRLCRPSRTGAPTVVDFLGPGNAERLPEPVSIPAILCRLWGYSLERVSVDQDEHEQHVLRFAASA